MSDHEEWMPGAQAGAFEQGLHQLLRASAKVLVRDAAPGPYLDWIVRDGMALGAGLLPAEAQPPAPQADQLMRLFGHVLYAMLPLPQHDFRPREIALPRAQQACLCGSLQAFGGCCAPLLAGLPRLPPEMAVAHVLEAWGRRHWHELPQRRVEPRLIEAAAESFKQARRLHHAVALLEPWAAQDGPYPDDWAGLLDLLGDLYAELRRPRKRRALALAMIERGGPEVQSKGWQRCCLMATDAGRRAQALQAFVQAQRLNPEDPALALLELTMLLGFGDTAMAGRRAQFHRRRLQRRNGDGRYDDLIAGVRALGERGQGFVEDLSLAHEPELARLDAWLRGLPAAQARLLCAGATPQDLGELQSDAAVAGWLPLWSVAFDPASAWTCSPRWLPLLEQAPLLGDSFAVLDALATALQAHASPGAEAVLRRIGQRAADLWALLRARWPRAACRWAVAGNRPALRLLVQHLLGDDTPRADHSFDALRHLVEVLDPEDGHGLRLRLAVVYLRRGAVHEALALSGRRGHDGDGLRLARVLALWRVGRRTAAGTLLVDTVRRNPKLVRALRPPAAPGGAPGRGEQWDLWQEPELRELLATALRRAGTRA